METLKHIALLLNGTASTESVKELLLQVKSGPYENHDTDICWNIQLNYWIKNRLVENANFTSQS